MRPILLAQRKFGWPGIFFTAVIGYLIGYSTPSSSKRGASSVGDSHETGKSSSFPKTQDQLRIADYSPPVEMAGGMPPDWERKLEAEIRTVASETQMMDSPDAVRRGVAQARKSLGTYSLDELSDMAKALADPAKASIQRFVMLGGALTEMASRNPETALRFIRENMPSETHEGNMAFLVFPEIARKDPAFLSSWLSKTTTDWRKPSADLLEGVKALAGVSPEAAFSLIEASPASANRETLYAAAFRRLGESDAGGAVRKLETLDPKYRSLAIGEIATGLAVTNKKGAIDWLVGNKDTPISPSCVTDIFDRWLASDKDGAFASLKTLPEAMLINVLGSIGTSDRLQRKDPAAALDLLARLTPTRSNEHVIVQNLAWFIRLEPDRVVAWLDDQTSGNVNLPMKNRLYSAWAQQDPEATFAALKSRPEILQDEGVVTGLARGMAGSSLAETVKWSENLPPQQRDRFRQAAVGFAAEKQPRNVVDYLAAEPNREGPEIYQKLGASLVNLDINEAKNWSLRQTGKLGEAAVAGVVAGWVKSDAEGASIWLSALPPGPTRNAGIKVLVDEVAESEPAAAAKWRKLLGPAAQK